MSTVSQHTPTPWATNVGSRGELNMVSGKKTNERPMFTIASTFHRQGKITNGPEATIGEVFYGQEAIDVGGDFRHRISAMEAQKNMEFIVNAVNCHDDLLDALKKQLARYEKIINVYRNYIDPTNDFHAYEAMREILGIIDNTPAILEQRASHAAIDKAEGKQHSPQV